MTAIVEGNNFMNAHALQHMDVDLPIGITPEYVKETVVAIMYSQNKLDLKSAREIMGVSRREFEDDILPKDGVTGLGDDDIDIEINEILNEK